MENCILSSEYKFFCNTTKRKLQSTESGESLSKGTCKRHVVDAFIENA